eukprot:5482577-Pyramimonas_sp.AAC.1
MQWCIAGSVCVSCCDLPATRAATIRFSCLFLAHMPTFARDHPMFSLLITSGVCDGDCVLLGPAGMPFMGWGVQNSPGS